MIKNLIILGLIVTIGALTHASWWPHLDMYIKKYTEKATTAQTATPVATSTETTVVAEVVKTDEPKVEVKKKAEVKIDESGSLLEGPYALVDAQGKDTGATAEIIRSPEETLLQFKNVSFMHSASAELHLAKDVKGKDYLNLGPARINSGVLIYGLPLDLDLGVFTHLFFYNPDTNVNEFVVQF